MKVTILIENSMNHENRALKCEHGFSALIEHEGKKILLDAGTTASFLENGKILGEDLTDLECCVLSHGHYDHSGGFQALFEQNEQIKVYAQKTAVEDYFSGNGEFHEIGIPKEVLAYSDRFMLADGAKEILPDVYLVPHTTEGLGRIGEKAKLYKKAGTEIVPDDFIHEQSLVFDTEKGLVIFNSCSHGGMANIIAEAKSICDNKPVCAYIGGLHMKGKVEGVEVCTFSEEELDSLAGDIRNERIEKIYTGHCTGLPGLEKMQKRLGDKIVPLMTGLTFEI